MGRPAQSWSNFSKRLLLDGGCWRFQGPKDKDGYGISSIKGKKMPAHRAAFILWYNETVIRDMFVLHRCSNRDCCNPAHLYAGTQKENIQDQISAGTFVRGSKNGFAKLDESKVAAARESNLSCRELANMNGVSYSTMWDVLNNRSWRQV